MKYFGEHLMKDSIRKKIWIPGLLLLTLFVAFYSPLNPVTEKALTTDQAVFFTIAQGILNGDLAYVDFFDHKGPLLYLILAAGLLLGKSLIGNFLLEFLIIFISALFMFKIARMFAGKWISFLTVAVIFLSDITLFTTSNSEEYLYPLLVISVYLFLFQLRRGIKYLWTAGIGFCGMLVFFIKYNYCLIWAALGILMFLIMLGRRESWKKVLGMCFSFAGGMAAAAVLMGMYLLATGSFSAFMETYVLYSLHYAEATGIPERIQCLKYLLATPLFGLLAISALALVILSILSLVRRKEKIAGFTGEMLGEIWIFYLLAAAILVTTASPGQSWYYYKQATMVIYTVPLAFLGQAFMEICKKWQEKAGKILGVVATAAISLGVLVSQVDPQAFLIQRDERFQGAMNLCAVIQETCGPKDTMISFSNDCTMYFYSECPPASRIFFPSATIVDDALIDELMGDLREKRPRIVTFQSDWKAGLSQRMIDEAEDFIRDDYGIVYEDVYRTAYIRK